MTLIRITLLLLGMSMAAAVQAAGYSVSQGRILDPSGHAIQLRGINHFGFNGTILQPQYLWEMGWKEQIAQIKALGFNAVRLPYVPDTLYVDTPVDELSFVKPELNQDILGKTPLQVLDLWIREADRQGLYILLDFHSVSPIVNYSHWFVDDPSDYDLIYNNRAYTREDWIRDLVFVAKRYADIPRFIGVDLYNEPHDVVRWDDGDAQRQDARYFWKPAAEAAARAVLQANPNILVFVEGINGNFDGIEVTDMPMNWGEDLQPQRYAPLDIPKHKLVLAPHSYGPDVFQKESFDAPNFPHNLAADWEKLFGQFYPEYAVVVGEWGGKYGEGTGGEKDAQWQNAFADYLVKKGMTSSFYWAYTPNSHDAGGILDDDLEVRQDKMAVLRKTWAVASPGSPVGPGGGGGNYGGGGWLNPALLLALLLGAGARLYSRGDFRRTHR